MPSVFTTKKSHTLEASNRNFFFSKTSSENRLSYWSPCDKGLHRNLNLASENHYIHSAICEKTPRSGWSDVKSYLTKKKRLFSGFYHSFVISRTVLCPPYLLLCNTNLLEISRVYRFGRVLSSEDNFRTFWELQRGEVATVIDDTDISDFFIGKSEKSGISNTNLATLKCSKLLKIFSLERARQNL